MRKVLKKHLAFILFIALYATLGYINLDRLPVAWTDEVLNLDPAVQFIETGTYTSKLWPNPKSDVFFASYLPGLQWFQTVYLQFLPIEIFWIRLPFFLLNLASIFLIYTFFINQKNLSPFFTTLLISVIFLDKASFELMRSMRVEPIIIFGVSVMLHLSKKRKYYLVKALLIGYLAMCHVYIWPVLLAWFLIDWLPLSATSKITYALVALMPSFAFWASADFDFYAILEQMGFHAQQHTVVKTDLPHHPMLNSIWYRFYPYYLEQPLNPAVFLIVFISISYLTFHRFSWKNSHHWLSLSWIVGLILLFAILTPQYRYLPVFWLLGIAIIGSSNRINWEFRPIKFLLIALSINASLSFMGRHTAAILQKEARNITAVHDFLRKELADTPPSDSTKILLLGESIGFYHAHRGRHNQRMDYGIDFYPQHLNWSNYTYVYLLTHDIRPQDSFIATYQSSPEKIKTPNFMQSFAKGGTYDGMHIYQLKP